MTLTSVLIIGFVLGIKHALEPDHIVAVSTIVGRSHKLRDSMLAGVFWGIGHTMTLFIIGIVLIIAKGEIPEIWAASLEFIVGIMLVYLGIINVISRRASAHSHTKAPKSNHMSAYFKSTLIGFVHGLAGSAAMVLLTMSTVQSAWEGALYILIFGIGTIIGMLLFTTALGIPFSFSVNHQTINRVLIRLTGVASIVFGAYHMYEVATIF